MNPSKSNNDSFLSPQHMEEKRWVRKVREEGDRQAYEQIFRAYYKRLNGFAYSYLMQKEAAEDVVQSVFLNIWSERECWDPPGTVKQYLFAAVRNEALNKIRYQHVVKDKEEEVVQTFKDLKKQKIPDSEYSLKELESEIEKGIEALPPRCRQIFLLNRRSGLTYNEIADYLDISINTVNTQMGRALKSLRDYLSDYLPVIVALGVSPIFF